MAEEQRRFLWQIEHHGTILSQFCCLALTKDDERALVQVLAPDFIGTVPQPPDEGALDNEIIPGVRQSDTSKPPAKLDARHFATRLLEYRRSFKHAIKGGKIVWMQLRPMREDNREAPQEGTGQLRLWGESGPGQPAAVIVYFKYLTVLPSKDAMSGGGWLLTCTIAQSQVSWSERFPMREAKRPSNAACNQAGCTKTGKAISTGSTAARSSDAILIAMSFSMC
jgi:hypothetical protein